MFNLISKSKTLLDKYVNYDNGMLENNKELHLIAVDSTENGTDRITCKGVNL